MKIKHIIFWVFCALISIVVFIFISSNSVAVDVSFAEEAILVIEEYRDMKADRVRIDDEDVRTLKSLLCRRAWRDSPSCPCGGVYITFRSDKRELTIYPAGDSCPTIRISRERKDYFFYLTDDQNAAFKEMMGKYGVKYPFGI